MSSRRNSQLSISKNHIRRFETVFPACGSNSAIELTINELEKYSGYTEWVDVCKLHE